jgi:hypothetical protein
MLEFHYKEKKGKRITMTYKMSWERTRNVWDELDTDTDTITDENDYLDEDLFIPTPNFDPLEIL